jgi:hypothetical protein
MPARRLWEATCLSVVDRRGDRLQLRSGSSTHLLPHRNDSGRFLAPSPDERRVIMRWFVDGVLDFALELNHPSSLFPASVVPSQNAAAGSPIDAAGGQEPMETAVRPPASGVHARAHAPQRA